MFFLHHVPNDVAIKCSWGVARRLMVREPGDWVLVMIG